MADTTAASAAYFIPFLRIASPLVRGAAGRVGGVLVQSSADKHRSCCVACALLTMIGRSSSEHAFEYIAR
jgi:hypothetical protein